jgi:hypothetical protein
MSGFATAVCTTSAMSSAVPEMCCTLATIESTRASSVLTPATVSLTPLISGMVSSVTRSIVLVSSWTVDTRLRSSAMSPTIAAPNATAATIAATPKNVASKAIPSPTNTAATISTPTTAAHTPLDDIPIPSLRRQCGAEPTGRRPML